MAFLRSPGLPATLFRAFVTVLNLLMQVLACRSYNFPKFSGSCDRCSRKPSPQSSGGIVQGGSESPSQVRSLQREVL